MARRSGHGARPPGRSWSSNGRAEPFGQPVAARRPSPQWSHIGPGPGLVDEDQPLRFDAALILCPLGAPTRHVGTIAFASHHAFFEAELLGMDELPYRAVVDLQSAPVKFGNEPAQGEIAGSDPLR